MDPSHLNDLPAPELIERMATGDPIRAAAARPRSPARWAAGLLRMVVALTSGRPAAAGDEKELTEIAIGAATCQSELLNLVELDAVAYDGVIRARRLPRGTDIERQARAVQVAAATREATRAPLQTARLAEQVLKLAERTRADRESQRAISDAGVGALLAVAALRGAVLNVQINLPYLARTTPCAIATDEVERLLNGLDDREHAIREQVEGQLGDGPAARRARPRGPPAHRAPRPGRAPRHDGRPWPSPRAGDPQRRPPRRGLDVRGKPRAGGEGRRRRYRADRRRRRARAGHRTAQRGPRVAGIVVAQPFEDVAAGRRLVEHIDPEKDVDGATPTSAGRLARGEPAFVPRRRSRSSRSSRSTRCRSPACGR